jgi:hypothetical protein
VAATLKLIGLVTTVNASVIGDDVTVNINVLTFLMKDTRTVVGKDSQRT